MKRYFPQIIAPGVGAEGQQKMAAASVLIIGAGGLGTPAAAYLVAAGIGRVGIIDGDTVAESNLSRQFFYNESDIGANKAERLADKLRHQNSLIKIEAIPQMLNETNAKQVIDSYGLVCDCSDNVDARILSDRICGELKKPLMYAAVKEWEAYITLLHGKANQALGDIFAHELLKENAELNCSIAGIINTICGIAGSLQANECLKWILGMDSDLDGGILCIDAGKNIFKIFRIQ